MSKLNETQSEADKIAAVEEALRINEQLVTEQEDEVADLKATVARLQKENFEAKAKQPFNLEEQRFVLDGQEYQVTCPAMILNGHKVTALQVCEDVASQRQLVKVKSGCIKPVERN